MTHERGFHMNDLVRARRRERADVSMLDLEHCGLVGDGQSLSPLLTLSPPRSPTPLSVSHLAFLPRVGEGSEGYREVDRANGGNWGDGGPREGRVEA